MGGVVYHPLFPDLCCDPTTGEFSWLRESRRGIRADGSVGTVNGQGYKQINYKGKIYLLHRLVWLFANGEWPAKNLDHINGTRSDNRIENLRLATYQDNARNQKLHSRNTSGFSGVSQDSRGLWDCRIGSTRLGFYPCRTAAVVRRKQEEVKLGYSQRHGEKV